MAVSKAKRIYQIISWGLVILTLASIVLALLKPSFPPVEARAAAADSFDKKLTELEQAHQQGTPREVHISEVELNSRVQEILQGPPPAGAAALTGATIHFEDDRLVAIFTINVEGKNVYLTVGGKLVTRDGSIDFNLDEMKLGRMPVPVWMARRSLRGRLNSPDVRDLMKPPESIKDARIENGELVLEGK